MTPGIGRLGVLPGAGHFPWLDDGAAYFDVFGFLSEVSPRARSGHTISVRSCVTSVTGVGGGGGREGGRRGGGGGGGGSGG